MECARRVASAQILGVLDDWEKLDVSALNIDDIFRRFTNKRAKDFTPGSLGSYKSRFTSAVNEFLAHAKNPEGWKPNVQERTAAPKREKPATAVKAKQPERQDEGQAALPGQAGLVEYPFPLREGSYAFLRLPPDLKMAEVKRLTAFMTTMAIDAE